MGSATKSTLKPLPMLGLSRVRRRNQKVEKPQQSRLPRRTSPQCKVPLPSSFVDATASLLAQRERAFLESSEDEEEKEEEKKRRLERAKQKQSEKEKIRRRLAEAKMKLSHRFNVSAPIAEEDNDAILNESSQRSDTGDLLQQNPHSVPTSKLATSSHYFENPTQNNDDQHKKSRTGEQQSRPIDESLLHFIVDGCFHEVKDPSRVSVKELLHQVATKLHRKSLSKSQRAAARSRITELLLSWQKEQEKPERLLQVIRGVFERFAATTDGLHNCSLEQFLEETQKHFATPFSIEAQEFVKVQLKDLVRKFQKRDTEKENVQRIVLPRAPPEQIHPPTQAHPIKPVVAPITGSNTKTAPPLDTGKAQPGEQRYERESATTAAVPDAPQTNATREIQLIAKKTADLSRRTIPATGQPDNDSLSFEASCVAVVDSPAVPEPSIVAKRTGKLPIPTRRPIRARKTASEQRRDDPRSLTTVDPPTPEEATMNDSLEVTNKARTDDLKRSKPQKRTKSDSPAKKARKPPTKRKSCSLCLKCPCNDTSRNSVGTTTAGLAQTDVAIEKALIRRLAKLETVADQYEEQTEAVRRKLKKHRRDVWKKREDLLRRAGDQIANKRSATYFLPDVDELDDQFSKRKRVKRGAESAAKAKARLMNSKRPEPKQRTLTQMANQTENDEIVDPIVPDADTCETIEDPVLSDIDESSCDEDEAAFTNVDIAVRRVCPTEHGNGSLWDGVQSGNFQSDFDKLFDEQVVSDESDGVEQLLELMMPSPKKKAPSTANCDESPSNLSSRGKRLMEEVTENTLADTTNLHAIEELCPQWKENVVFAMAQRESTDITDAMRNVQEEKHRLIDLREKFLQAIEKRVTTLDFYEKTLEVSASRMGGSGSGTAVSESEP